MDSSSTGDLPVLSAAGGVCVSKSRMPMARADARGHSPTAPEQRTPVQTKLGSWVRTVEKCSVPAQVVRKYLQKPSQEKKLGQRKSQVTVGVVVFL